MSTPAIVSTVAPKKVVQGTPQHWNDSSSSSGFNNPWPSWKNTEFTDMVHFMAELGKFPSVTKEDKSLIPIRKPTWGVVKDKEESQKDKIKSTWLGHACFLVEMPSRSDFEGRGVTILFDPVFSDRCSPSQWIGPKRFTRPPCEIEDIPEVDAVVISHNHYDHLDTPTIKTLSKRPRVPHFFAPLGNGPFFKSFNIPETNIHIMDWWDTKRVEVSIPSKDDGNNTVQTKLAVDITCTPAQHFTGRSLFDRFKTLWASWSIEEVHPRGETGVKVFFGGDTGYRAVPPGKNEDEVPVCPVFKEIGERFGGFDFAMIPIGAYQPRRFMSPIHCAPQDSVRLFKDIRVKKALGMHWGTWVLTTEDVFEPPKKLKEECEKIGIEDGVFTVCEIGETMFFN